jgi:KipI family sensor histidine kinase inhibitor
MNVRFLHSGDTALVVEFGDRVDPGLSDRVLRLSGAVRRSRTPGIIETVPTFRSLFVLYDPLMIDSANLISNIEKLLDESQRELTPAKLWRIPACYELSYAPDLPEIADRTGRSPEEIIHLHSTTRFHVYMIGFLPGHPYMGDLPDMLALPRRVDPRVRVPAGSIAIANKLSVIYPVESPGGWHLIGATPVRLFNPEAERPSLLSPGDKVQFDRVSPADFSFIRTAVENGQYQVRCEMLVPDAVP